MSTDFALLTAQQLTRIYGYDLDLCVAFLSTYEQVEPTEERLHAFALDYSEAEHESWQERLEHKAREDRWYGSWEERLEHEALEDH